MRSKNITSSNTFIITPTVFAKCLTVPYHVTLVHQYLYVTFSSRERERERENKSRTSIIIPNVLCFTNIIRTE